MVGGLTAAGAASDTTWMMELGSSDTTVTWHPYAQRGTRTAWHTAKINNPIFNRLPEIFDPAASPGSQWSDATTGQAYLLQEWYPQMFLAPDGKVFNSGPSETSYRYDPATRQWSAFPASGTSGFVGGSAVMYRPGKVMKCGTRDTQAGTAVATTETIDLTAGSPSWQSSGAMTYGRVNMNLTLLPTGSVLVTGGTSQVSNLGNIGPVRQPEIWDPAANGGAGAWSGGSGANRLDSSSVARGYHTVALLLPDGRILCAGGYGDNIGDDPIRGDVFCPPYLFQDANPTVLATRPTHASPPAAHMKWGRVFTIATERAASIKSVCLIKPGATTHAFDEDQRYVPLAFTAATNPSRLLVTAPADSNVAPPGDYLLFLLDSTATAQRVPSIATWIKLDRHFGRDSADAVVPGSIADVAFDLSSSSIILEWTSPADDTLLAASGPVITYDIRDSTGTITDASWSATRVVPFTAHSPYGVGSTDWVMATGLSPCTTYHFRLRAQDDNLAYGARTADLTATTLGTGCGGGGGMGGAAHELGGGADVTSSGPAAGANDANGSGANRAVIVQTTRTAQGAWRIVASQAASAAALGLPDSSGMFVQMPDGAGGYQPALQVRSGADDEPIGLCALRDGRRVVLAGGYAVQTVAATLHSGVGDLELTDATLGSAGALGAEFVAAGGAVNLADNDSLTLTYEPSASASDSTAAWYLIVARSGASPFAAWPQRPVEGPLPARFALHPNQPNPFRSATQIRFDLPVGARVRLEVFDAQGRRVRTLANQFYPAGYHAVSWEPARDDAGRVGPGVYFYRIEAGAFRDRRKMVLTGH